MSMRSSDIHLLIGFICSLDIHLMLISSSHVCLFIYCKSVYFLFFFVMWCIYLITSGSYDLYLFIYDVYMLWCSFFHLLLLDIKVLKVQDNQRAFSMKGCPPWRWKVVFLQKVFSNWRTAYMEGCLPFIVHFYRRSSVLYQMFSRKF